MLSQEDKTCIIEKFNAEMYAWQAIHDLKDNVDTSICIAVASTVLEIICHEYTDRRIGT